MCLCLPTHTYPHGLVCLPTQTSNHVENKSQKRETLKKKEEAFQTHRQHYKGLKRAPKKRFAFKVWRILDMEYLTSKMPPVRFPFQHTEGEEEGRRHAGFQRVNGQSALRSVSSVCDVDIGYFWHPGLSNWVKEDSGRGCWESDSDTLTSDPSANDHLRNWHASVTCQMFFTHNYCKYSGGQKNKR